MNKRIAAACATAAALMGVAFAAAPASAQSYRFSAAPTSTSDGGALAGLAWDMGNAEGFIPVHLHVRDTAADGHHAQARIYTTSRPGGPRHYWGWIGTSKGEGDFNDRRYNLRDSKDGIWSIGVQAAVFEGTTVLSHRESPDYVVFYHES